MQVNHLTLKPTNKKTIEENNKDIIGHITTNMYIENNLIFGDQVIDKGESISRILFQIVNGRELTSHRHTLELVCDLMRHHLIDSVCLCETNSRWKHNSGLKKSNYIASKFWKRKRIITSESIII